jgi:hypothetical protein
MATLGPSCLDIFVATHQGGTTVPSSIREVRSLAAPIIAMGEGGSELQMAVAQPGTIESKPLARFDGLQSGLVTLGRDPPDRAAR